MFSRFAAAGLAILFGVQAAINMAVNLQLIPAKGMTLPFISYGGSSILSLAYGVGMMLALTRQRPRTEMEFEQRSRRGAQLRVSREVATRRHATGADRVRCLCLTQSVLDTWMTVARCARNDG